MSLITFNYTGASDLLGTSSVTMCWTIYYVYVRMMVIVMQRVVKRH